MAIYEKFVGASRDDFLSLQDAEHNYRLNYNDNFNFAYDVVDEISKKSPNKRSMIYLDNDLNEKVFTFEDMKNYSNKAACYLHYMGIKKGDRVLLVLRRSYYFWFCVLGLHKIGAIIVQATDQLKERDYIYRCNEGGITTIIAIANGDAKDIIDKASKSINYKLKKFLVIDKDFSSDEVIKEKEKNLGDWIDFVDGFNNASMDWQRPIGENDTKVTDTMLMAFSSGTSGYPKIITHNFAYPLGHVMTGVFWHRVIDGGLHFTISDTGWLKCLWGKLYGQWFGESAVLVYDFDRFNAEKVLYVMSKYKVTTFCAPPTIYRMMLQQQVENYDLSSLTHCCTAGEALNPIIFDEWYKRTGFKMYEGYGQTETCLCIATIYPWTEPAPGAIGLPVPGFDVHILSEDNSHDLIGANGEISIRVLSSNRKSCGLLDSYNFSNEDTDKVLYNGYYHTGDIAYRDEKGLFHYVGRNDDVIKSSGYRIGPFEIESVLLEHDAVSEVAVTGVKDSVRGFVVKATIVLEKGYEGSDTLTKELQEYVKRNTAPYKYPRMIEYVDSLPKTFNGKIQRAKIRNNDLMRSALVGIDIKES